MLNETSLAQLLVWSSEPGLLPRVPAGPDRDKSWNLVSAASLWELAASRDADLRSSALTELRRREADLLEPAAPAQARLL